MNLWCKDTTVCAINSTFSVDFYTFFEQTFAQFALSDYNLY